MTVVCDAASLLRLVGLVQGPRPTSDEVISTDAVLGEIIDFLRLRFDGRPGPVHAALGELQMAVVAWARLADLSFTAVRLACDAATDLPTAVLSPIALAAEAELPFVTSSRELADLAAGRCPEVRYLA